MSGKITLVPINKGIKTDRTAFNIDDDSFPQLVNAYQWRGRIKRKRGTSLLTRFERNVTVTTQALTAGSINLISIFTLGASSSIVPGSISLLGSIDGTTYTDPSKNGTLTVSGGTGTAGTINYATGVLTIIGGASETVTGSFSYYPTLPVMGLEQFTNASSAFPGTIGFDTTYSYNILTNSPYTSYDVSFYKNPLTGSYPSYVQKTTPTSLTWHGNNYQQFWTTNYQGCMWTTNGTAVPFDKTIVGMQYKEIISVTVNSTTTASLNITGHGLVVGDFVFINEVVTTTGINFQTGYVVTVTDANNVVVKFPYATLTTNGTGGIAQYLTSNAIPGIDPLRWYDGDPTAGTGLGWANFSPPLSQLNYSVSDNPLAQYYLVGARMIIPFKDRLLFLGPVIQTSSASSQVYLQDTIIYSQNGTPFYTSSYTNTPSATVDAPASITNEFNPILVPEDQTATSPAFFEDQDGFGGYNQAGVDQPIVTVSNNEDVLIVGFTGLQTRYVYTGNDLLPFNFFTINSELGSQSTFSSVNLDRGVITVGNHGFVITAQTGAQRIDLDIPDQIFQFNISNNGSERVCAQRDFINEWIYFTYVDNEFSQSFSDSSTYVYPNQTLQYNYRDNSWAIFNETYTTYGTFRKKTGLTWATLPSDLTWATWNTPWNSGSSTLLQPNVIAGNQQGFVLERVQDTSEGNSLAIQNITNSLVTSPNHGLNSGDYIVINGALGTVGAAVNGKIFSVGNPLGANTFTLNPSIPTGLTYLGSATIQRMYVPLIQTKQFNPAWSDGRKTRIGSQQYLFSKTNNGQVTINIYLSQDDDNAWNSNLSNPTPNGLVYSQIVYTCPESTNLGLTPMNTNLQMPIADSQQQIWHRMNTSMIGDTIQLGITLSDAQMRDPNFKNQFTEIEFHGAVFNISPSSLLS